MTNMKPRKEGRNTGAPSLRSLEGRSAIGLNGQAAKGEVSGVWQGGWMPENISDVPAGRSVFHLTSPFIGLLARIEVRPSRPITSKPPVIRQPSLPWLAIGGFCCFREQTAGWPLHHRRCATARSASPLRLKPSSLPRMKRRVHARHPWSVLPDPPNRHFDFSWVHPSWAEASKKTCNPLIPAS